MFNTGGPHGFSEVLYAFSSAGNNNGSAFAGIGANTPFYNIALGVAMILGRYWLAIPALAIAGSLVGKKKVAVTSGTLPTHTPSFHCLAHRHCRYCGSVELFPGIISWSTGRTSDVEVTG